MVSMFSSMEEEVMEIFMDDFSVYGSSFQKCLNFLETVIQRCQERNLALNCKKYYYIIAAVTVLGHMISTIGLEVDEESKSH